MCCSVLQCVAAGGLGEDFTGTINRVFYSVLQYVATCCSMLHCVALCCSVLQCVAVCCSVLQCVAADESAEDFDGSIDHVLCIVLQCVAVHCNMLQCLAVFRSVL